MVRFSVVALNLLFLATEALLAWQDHTGTLAQMLSQGNLICTPFVLHGGAIGDVLFLTFLLPIVIGYADRWQSRHVWWCLLFASLASWGMNEMWVGMSMQVPNCFARHGFTVPAGYLHVLYSSLALTLAALFYGWTPGLRRVHLRLVAGLSFAHLLTGVYFPAWRVGEALKLQNLFSVAICGVAIWYFYKRASKRVVNEKVTLSAISN